MNWLLTKSNAVSMARVQFNAVVAATELSALCAAASLTLPAVQHLDRRDDQHRQPAPVR